MIKNLKIIENLLSANMTHNKKELNNLKKDYNELG